MLLQLVSQLCVCTQPNASALRPSHWAAFAIAVHACDLLLLLLLAVGGGLHPVSADKEGLSKISADDDASSKHQECTHDCM